MNLADFSAISNGNYNLGSIRLADEGGQASLVKINNHRWLANNVPDDPVQNAKVREAFCYAIVHDGGIPQDVINRITSKLTSLENIGRPLERREVRSVLQQIGESRMKDNGIHVTFSGKPKLNTALAMTALSCLPQKGGEAVISKLVISAAVKAFEKGRLALNKDILAEARVQVFKTLFADYLRDAPTDAELRAMTPEDFFARCSAAFDKLTTRMGNGEAEDQFPDNSLFRKFRQNTDFHTEQQRMCGNLQGNFSLVDVETLTDGLKEFNMANLPSFKVQAESEVNSEMRNCLEKDSDEGLAAYADEKIGKDIAKSRLKSELRFSIENDRELTTINPKTDTSEALVFNRDWIKGKIENMATTTRQASVTKALVSQMPLQPFRHITHLLGLYEYDEHSGFDYYLNKNDDGSLKLEIKKDFTEYGDRNISASFTWRIDANGTATMDDFKIKLPR